MFFIQYLFMGVCLSGLIAYTYNSILDIKKLDANANTNTSTNAKTNTDWEIVIHE